MRSVSIFLELNSEGAPLYKDIFLSEVLSGETVYASSEYMQLLNEDQKTCVKMIPEKITEELDGQITNKMDRSSLLKISCQEKLENWFQNEIDSMQGYMDILLFGAYESILNVARRKHFPCLIYENSSVCISTENNEKYYQKIIQDMRNHINFIEEQLRESQEALETLRKDIESNGHYIHNLEEHATELDKEKEKYRVFYENNFENVEKMNEREKYYEDRIDKYLEMYKEVVKELDEKKTEVLDLKKSLERKK